MRVIFNMEARDRYLHFAEDPAARWRGNFRDLAASITRMATLSPTGASIMPSSRCPQWQHDQPGFAGDR
jgi:sigma54-dependent transcription regulator